MGDDRCHSSQERDLAPQPRHRRVSAVNIAVNRLDTISFEEQRGMPTAWGDWRISDSLPYAMLWRRRSEQLHYTSGLGDHDRHTVDMSVVLKMDLTASSSA